jgi:hypothetical protein
MSGAQKPGTGLSDDELLVVRQREIGTRLIGVVTAIGQGTEIRPWPGGLMLAVSHLLKTWSVPGREAEMLISASDFLADCAAQYPVEKPR